MPQGTPTVRLRRLAAVLRELRAKSGLSIAEVSKRIGWSTARISRAETAMVHLPAADLAKLLDLYEVKGAQREAIVRLARKARERGWWENYDDELGDRAFVGFESDAVSIRIWESSLIPGLLQTPTYAASLFEISRPKPTPEEIERRVEARMARQIVLERQAPLEFWAVIDVNVLRAADDDQVRKLIAMAERKRIKLQVLESEAMHAGLFGVFQLFEFDDGPPLVYLQTGPDGVYLDREEDIADYRAHFEDLSSLAIGAPETLHMLREYVDPPPVLPRGGKIAAA